MTAINDRLAIYRPHVVREMRDIVGDDPAPLYSWMRYHLGWEDTQGHPAETSPGKLLRPAALLLAAEALGGEIEQALPAAAAVQLVHDFSLLHDDIEDVSETRRGRATLWTITGIAQAINAGDGMYTLSRLALLRLRDRGLDAQRTLEVITELEHACLRLIEGQQLDISFEDRSTVSHDEYLAMIEGKTAALLAACFAMGAQVAGAPEDSVDAMREFGRQVGLAFQAADDLLGIWGDPAVTGKPVGDDLISRKQTYPVIAAIESGEAPALASAYRDHPDAAIDIAALADEIEAAGARAATERLAADQVEAAMSALTPLSLGDDRALFAELAELLSARDA